jgi:GNAT superfamily N-acetyltransferase
VTRSVRLYEPRDFDRVHEVCVRGFTAIHEGFEQVLGPEIFAREFPDWQGRYADDIRRLAGDAEHELHVVEEGGQIIGFIATRVDPTCNAGEIGLNAVDPDHQGRGIGKEIYAFALSKLKQRGAVFAYVGTGGDEAHAPARAAYEAVGFDRVVPSVHLYRKL